MEKIEWKKNEKEISKKVHNRKQPNLNPYGYD